MSKAIYLLMFIMRPTNGWDERARTAPVPIIPKNKASERLHLCNYTL